MKNIKIIVILSIFSFTALQAQVARKTVSMGPGYAQMAWYNLETDVQTKGAATGWDLAISVRGFDASIFTHPFDTLYRSVNTLANFDAVAAADTLPKSPSRVLYNSDTSWTVGGINTTSTGTFDYGWGAYNQATYNVVGDSTYLIKLTTGVWKKITIEKLSFDTSYFIKYANLDGTNPQRIELNKKNYAGKNFVYLNLTTNAILDLEPKSANWHIAFMRYQSTATDPSSGKPAPFVVSGVLTNTVQSVTRGVASYNGSSFTAKIIRRDTASDAVASSDFKTSISTIGSDWKTYDYTNSRYNVSDSSTYFVKTPTGRIYKLIFTGFGGSQTGDFNFSSEYLLGTSVQDPNDGVAALAISPNPASDGQIQLVFDLGKNTQNADFQLINLSGQTVFNQKLPTTEGLQTLALPSLGLTNGLYFARINFDGKVMMQKVVIH